MHDFDTAGHDHPGGGEPEAGFEADTLTVHVDGHDGAYEPTADLDGDGHAESVLVEGGEPGTTEGGYAYSDTSGDGTADTLTEYDAHGEVVAQAVYEESSGAWREVSPGSVDVTGHVTGDLTVDTAQGPENAGPATVDTNGDGVPDTAVTHGADGTTVLVTDVDGDSSADVITEVGSDGGYATFTHTGVGEWTETDHGNLADGDSGGGDSDGGNPGGGAQVDTSTGGGGEQGGSGGWVTGPVTTDPATGEWRSV